MTATGEKENGPDIWPHQAAFIERFFADPSKRGHLLQPDVGLGTSYMIAHLIRRALEQEAYTRILLFAPKMLLMQMHDKLRSNRVDSDIVDRFRYRELQDAVTTGSTVWSTGRTFLLGMDFARQPDIAGDLVTVQWSLIVVLEAQHLRGQREELARRILVSSPNSRIVLIAPPVVHNLPTCGLNDFQKTEWRRNQVLDHAGKRLIVEPPKRLEVIEFEQGPAEREVYQALQRAAELVRSTGGSASLLADIMFRAFSSSPLAAESVIRRLRNRVDYGVAEIASIEDEQDNETELDEVIFKSYEPKEYLLKVLSNCLTGLESLSVDSKLNALVQRFAAWQIQGVLPQSICILTEYVPTLFYLQSELEEVGLHPYVLHGSQSMDERSRTIFEFKEHTGVLVATNASVSTGLALPFLDVLVFYDLPRSSVILYQLLGRFERIGRTAPLDVKVFLPRDNSDPSSNAMLAQLKKLLVD
jgi:hypothetical protein